MVIFAIPIITSIFTAAIGGITLHLAHRNRPNQDNTQAINQEVSQQIDGVQGDNNVGVGNRDGEGSGRELIQLVGFDGSGKKEGQLQETNGGGENTFQKIVSNQEPNDTARFVCPITHKIMDQPAQLLCGHCFQKQPLKAQLKKTKKCPVCDHKARCSQIYQCQDFKNSLQAYKAKRRARKLSRDRLIEDFGDDKFQYIIGGRKNSIGKGQPIMEEILHFSQDQSQSDKQLEQTKLRRSHYSLKQQGNLL